MCQRPCILTGLLVGARCAREQVKYCALFVSTVGVGYCLAKGRLHLSQLVLKV